MPSAIADFLVSRVPFLSGLSAEEGETLALAAQTVSFKTGQTLIMQGVTIDGLHVLVSGKVSVTIKPKGKLPIEVARLGPGEVFGERSIVEFGVANATIKAVEDTVVYLIGQDAFLKLIESSPARKEFILAQIAQRRKTLTNNPKSEPPKA